MTFLHRLVSVLRWLFNRNRAEQGLDDELQAYVSMSAAEKRREGVLPAEARRLAILELGGIEQAKERVRTYRHGALLDEIGRDFRYAFRMFVRNPGFTVVIVLTLTLGIGANTAIFTIVNGVLLRPLGYPKPEQLMHVTAELPALGLTRSAISAPEYMEFQEINRSFAAVGAYTTGGEGYTSGEVNLTAGDRPLRVRSVSVDAHLLNALGVQPAQGRLFSEEETTRWMGTLSPPIAILSDELWQTAFGGKALVGQTVEVEGRPHEILGIMPPGADVMDNRTEIWLPLWLHPNAARRPGSHALYLIARLKDGVTAEVAQTELNALLENWGERVGTKEHVPTNRPSRAADHTLQMRALRDVIVGSASGSIWVLQAAVGFILLIACANLANLVIARGESRRREFVVRAALGASRGRLLRQAMTEGVLVSGAGGMLGLWLAHAGVRALIRAYPTSVPRTSDVAIDCARVARCARSLSRDSRADRARARRASSE